ncbi:CFEM domain protein [Ceratobasidium sp. AG-Ba]|nr:CFEM domain protein [Ceratobasidium sp. AG-Ba]
MHFSRFFLLVLVAILQLVASAPTSGVDPVPSETPPEPSNPPPEPSAPPPETTSRRETTPRSTSTPTDTPTDTFENSETSMTLTDTLSYPSTTSIPPAPTATSPSGGGQTCVQKCLAQAATDSGCNGFTDSRCICTSSSFMNNARNCFSDQNCDPAMIASATQDYSSVCGSLSVAGTTITSNRAGSATRTSWLPDSTVSGIATYVIQSGAVITVSNSVYTAGSVVTTTFSGKMGDFAGGNGVTRLGANGFGTSVPNSGAPNNMGSAVPVAAVTMIVGVVIGGLACLVI